MSSLRNVWKRCLILAALVLLLPLCGLAWLFHGTDASVPVLNYHQINDIAQNSLTIRTDQFEEQMKYLSENGYHTITPTEMLDAWENGTELPDKPVIITFDDGYVDNYQNAFPILEKYRLKATIFLISDYMGMYPNYLTWDQAKQMQQSGLIQLESHTLNHADLTKLDSTEEIRHELYGSKQAIEFQLGNTVQYIAYPCGAYTQEIADLTQAAGYRAAFTVNYGWADPNEQHFILDRVPIFGGISPIFLRFKLRLAYAPVIAPLSRLREQLSSDGYTSLADLIPIP